MSINCFNNYSYLGGNGTNLFMPQNMFYLYPNLFCTNPYVGSVWQTYFMNNLNKGIQLNTFNVPNSQNMFNFSNMFNMNFLKNLQNQFNLNLNNQTNSTVEKNNPNSSVTPVTLSNVNQSILNKAQSYVGNVNSSAEGNALFSPKNYKSTGWYKKYGRWGWCCDFAVYCAKETLGNKYPKDMITSSPDGLANKAKKHNIYLEVPSSNKESWLAKNVKPGCVIYMKGKGDSGKHIALVESINGSKIKAVSGNSGGKVKKVEYDINTSGIYGFVDFDMLKA